MKKNKDLCRAERLEIAILLGKRYSLRAIARALKRSPNTVSYEVKENSVNSVYDPLKADAKARLRKRMRRLEWSKIEQNPSLKKLVIEKLEEGWNPDEIAGWLERMKKPYVSKTAIYDWLRTSRGERYCELLYSKRKRVVHRKGKKTKRVIIPNRVGIERRNRGATNRTHYGHWEADTVVGRKGTPGGVKVVSERKSRLVLVQKVKTMRPSEHAETEQEMLEFVKVKSVTYDNGIENREYEKLGVPSFFCRPYASWQKGSVENANKMLRRYFPKGTDWREVTQKQIDQAVRLINNKPRKILGYRSALEVASEAGIINSESVLTLG